jgi:putative phosphoesterase
MIRIGLIADTHIPEAGPDLPAAAYAALAGCDRILHAGDLHTIEVVDRLERVAPVLASRGNGDDPRTRPPGVPDDPRVAPAFVITAGRVRVGLIHDLESTEYRSDEAAAALLARRFGERVDIAVCGHTHVPLVWGLADGTAIVNPGSPTMPYGYRGLVGTVGLIEVDDSGFEATVLDLTTGQPQLRMAGPGVAPLRRGPRPVGGR